MSEVLKALLMDLRQHQAFPELLKAVEAPRVTRYRPSKGMTAETFMAEAIHTSGALYQHEQWLALLKGSSKEEN